MSRSVLVDEPAAPTEARFTSKHDGLTTLFNAKFVENPSNVVANRFLRKQEGGNNLRVVETLGDAFKHSTLTHSEFVEPQRIASGTVHTIGFGEKASHLGHQLRPSRLVRERHVVLAVELDKAALGDQTRKQSALFDWHGPV